MENWKQSIAMGMVLAGCGILTSGILDAIGIVSVKEANVAIGAFMVAVGLAKTALLLVAKLIERRTITG